MKTKLIYIALSLLFFASTAFSQTSGFYFKVQPKTFLSLKGDTTVIVGLQGRFVGNVDLDLKNDTLYHRTFYIAFITEDGELINGFNTNSQLIVDDMVKAGAPLSAAMGQMNVIIRDLTFGTRSQKYQKAQLLASKYGYVLLSINEQDE